MRYRIAAILLALVIFAGSGINSAPAAEAGVHWQQMRSVLFHGGRYPAQPDGRNKCQLLEQAVSLCIDQYGGSGRSYLERLKKAGIPDLPDTIAEIDLYAGSMDHRAYTHLGWDAPVIGDRRNPDWPVRWETRKSILKNTVRYVFGFSKKDEERIAALSRMLYTVHIIGDHIAYSKTSYFNHREKILPLGGFVGETTVITEILKSCGVLFPRGRYAGVEIRLKTENTRLTGLLNREEYLRTDDGFSDYKAIAEAILQILSDELPMLLQNETCFKAAFKH